MTILVTGGTGLVGSRLLRRFVDAGVDCHALVRPGKEVPAGATRVEGDLLDADSFLQAVEGAASAMSRPNPFPLPVINQIFAIANILPFPSRSIWATETILRPFPRSSSRVRQRSWDRARSHELLR